MNDLINLVKNYAPALATALATGPTGLVVSAIAGKLGVSADVATITQAIAQDPQMAQKLAEIDASQFKVEQDNLTSRHVADMNSDSWLSKNIRPLTLVFILCSYLLLALLDASIESLNVRGAFVELLGQWGMLVMSFYFGGRTLEKITGMKK